MLKTLKRVFSYARPYIAFFASTYSLYEAPPSCPSLMRSFIRSFISDTGYTITDTEPAITDSIPYTEYRFRSDKLLTQHYEKHGIEMGFDSKEAYEKAASDAVNNPEALHKIEAEDGDDVYYVEATNEFVVVSTDGYIRTYFKPSGGKAYFDRQ